MRPTVLLLVAAALSGCARNPAPPGYLRPAERAAADPYGAWVEVDHADGLGDVEGELLALGPDSLYVLPTNGQVRALSLMGLRRARAIWYDPQTGLLSAWSYLGSLGTISNGWFAFLTLPMWLIGGPIATGAQSRAPIVSVTAPDWRLLVPYARFPQGLPPDLPRTLPPKPWTSPQRTRGR